MSNTFCQDEISKMNKIKLWNGVVNTLFESKDDEYKLYSTGDISISNGRVYVSLFVNLKLTTEILKEYNIL